MTGLNRFWIGSEEIKLPGKYSPMEPLGQGAYGIVFKAKDIRTGENVAIKKLRLSPDKPFLLRSALREVVVLARLNHRNVVRILSLYSSSPLIRDIYMIFNLMETDLASVIASKQTLSMNQVRFLFYQLLVGLAYIHSVGVMHRDIKPRNLLVNSNCHLRIGDFGLARTRSCGGNLTEYVCTRWYRAPEILCKVLTYDLKVDIFSAGCVLAEIVCRKPLLPGFNTLSQISLFIQRFGMQSPADIEWIPGKEFPKFINKVSKIVSPLGDLDGFMESAGVSYHLEPVNRIVRDMCTMNPCKRPSAEDMLENVWFESFPRGDTETLRGSEVRIPVPQLWDPVIIKQEMRTEMAIIAINNNRL